MTAILLESYNPSTPHRRHFIISMDNDLKIDDVDSLGYKVIFRGIKKKECLSFLDDYLDENNLDRELQIIE